MRTVYLNRGLPGSGKSTRTKRMAAEFDLNGKTVQVCSSDDFFITPCCGKYVFVLEKLKYAHAACQDKFIRALKGGVENVFVDNTNVSSWECEFYVRHAIDYGYEVRFLEPTTPWAFNLDELVKRNVHGVPREALERMLTRWVPEMTVEKALGHTEDEKAAVAARRTL